MGDGEPADPLRLRACPECDYSLEGLAEEGVCPECGRAYDQQYVVLVGRGRGQRDTGVGGTWRGSVAPVVWVGLLVFIVMRGRSALDEPMLVTWGVLGLVMLVAQGYARLFSAREPLMQLWASPAGVAQVVSTPEGRWGLWLGQQAWAWLFVPVYATVMALKFRASPGWAVGIVGTAVGVTGLVWWARGGARGGVSDGVPGLWPWGRVEKLEVGEWRAGRVRVRGKVVRRWWRVENPEWVMDVEVECDEATAGALRERLVGWWREARGSEVRKGSTS